MKIFTLPIRLPGINEYQNACRRHPMVGATMKKNCVKQVMTYLGEPAHLSWPAQFEIIYTEPNKKRDIDNITGFGSKVILDAFVKAGFLPDDGPTYVNKIDSTVTYGNEPQIEIYVKEQGDTLWTDISDIDKAFVEAQKWAEENRMPTRKEPVAVKKTKTKATKTETKRNNGCTLTMNLG